MSAEKLREAAALMRERSAKVPAGPWQSGDRIVWNDVPVREWHGSSIVADSDDGGGGCETAEIAEHIASWHPAVALAVADALDRSAAVIEEAASGPLAMAMTAIAEPLIDVARAYLGSDQ